jgi:hypothetical protein
MASEIGLRGAAGGGIRTPRAVFRRAAVFSTDARLFRAFDLAFHFAVTGLSTPNGRPDGVAPTNRNPC